MWTFLTEKKWCEFIFKLSNIVSLLLTLSFFYYICTINRLYIYYTVYYTLYIYYIYYTAHYIREEDVMWPFEKSSIHLSNPLEDILQYINLEFLWSTHRYIFYITCYSTIWFPMKYSSCLTTTALWWQCYVCFRQNNPRK